MEYSRWKALDFKTLRDTPRHSATLHLLHGLRSDSYSLKGRAKVTRPFSAEICLFLMLLIQQNGLSNGPAVSKVVLCPADLSSSGEAIEHRKHYDC